MRSPVWPTWSACGRQPRFVTTREPPTAPPSSVGELLEDREALGAADAAAAADDDASRVERTVPASGSSRRATRTRRSSSVELRHERLDLLVARLGRDRVRRDGQELRRPGQTRLLEQAAAPALAERARIGSPGCDTARLRRSSRQAARRAAPRRARAPRGRGRWRLRRARPAHRARSAARSRRPRLRRVARPRRSRTPDLARAGARRRAPRARQARRRRGRRRSGATAELAQHLDDPRRRCRALAEDDDRRATPPAGRQPQLRQPPTAAAGARRSISAFFAASRPWQRRVARQVDPLPHGHDRGQRQLEDLPAAACLAPHASTTPSPSSSPLTPVTTGSPSACATRMRDLVVARVGRLVAEEEQVEARRRGPRPRSLPRSPRRPSPRRRSRAGRPSRSPSPARSGAAPPRPAGRA